MAFLLAALFYYDTPLGALYLTKTAVNNLDADIVVPVIASVIFCSLVAVAIMGCTVLLMCCCVCITPRNNTQQRAKVTLWPRVSHNKSNK